MSGHVTACRWALVGFVLSGVIAMLFTFSVWYTFGYLGRTGGVLVTSGVLAITADSVSPHGIQLSANTSHAPYSLPTTSGPFVTIPLWLPFLAVSVASAIAWQRSRRKPPGHCQKCGYDLTGNVTGVCPECGVRIGETR